MFYKVIKNNKVIDVLAQLNYMRYQSKYDRMIYCDEEHAQAIQSSDQRFIWHVEGYYQIPVGNYETVQVEQIDQYEYEERKRLDMMTREEIIDEYTLLLLERQVL